MGIYACFCEVDHDLAPPEEWCYNCRKAHGYIAPSGEDPYTGRRPWEDGT